jgi:hypothetical protein
VLNVASALQVHSDQLRFPPGFAAVQYEILPTVRLIKEKLEYNIAWGRDSSVGVATC